MATRWACFSNGLIASHYVLPDTPVLWKQLEPVANINFDATCMVASAKSGFENVNQLLTFARKNPKQVTVGTNQGTSTALYTYAFIKLAGVEVPMFPLKGAVTRKSQSQVDMLMRISTHPCLQAISGCSKGEIHRNRFRNTRQILS